MSNTGRASDLPVVCTLDPATLKTRREGLLTDVLHAASQRQLLPDGLRLQFCASSDTLALITRAIDAERRCCRFLTFRLTLDPDEGPIALEMTGPTGTREFLSALLE